MATGGYRSTRGHSQDGRSTRHPRIDVREQNERTTNVVREVKKLLDAEKRRGTQIGQVEVERSTFNAKHSLDEGNFDLFKWEKRMPDECRPVNRDALLTSMAYANEIHDVSPIYRTKSRGGESADLSDALGALKKAKSDSERESQFNLCPILRSMDKNEIHRANRLFYSEILHLLPHLDKFKMSDAEYVVRAIRDTNYPLKEPEDLLCLVKSCDDYDDALRAIQNMDETSRTRSDDRRTPLRNSATTDDRHPPRNSPSYRDNDRADSGQRRHDESGSRRAHDSPSTKTWSRDRDYRDD